MQICPQCNNEFEDNLEKCPRCGYNYNTFLNCPYKISGNCVHLQEECDIQGLNFEDCTIYLHKSGIER